jgi:hypothetical protein
MRTLVWLSKAYVEVFYERGHSAIEPDRITPTRVHMFMPAPVRCRDQVPFAHGKFFALDHRASIAISFDHETHGVHRVPVGRGRFTGEDELSPYNQVRRRSNRDIRMLAPDESANCFFRRYVPHRFIECIVQRLPVPKKRRIRWAWLSEPVCAIRYHPVADEVLGADPRVEPVVSIIRRHRFVSHRCSFPERAWEAEAILL